MMRARVRAYWPKNSVRHRAKALVFEIPPEGAHADGTRGRAPTFARCNELSPHSPFVFWRRGVIGGIAVAAMMFLQPLPGPSQKARAAPIPPKIAEGIARKNEPWPAEEKKEPVAPVIATVAPRAILRDLSPEPARKKAKRPRRDNQSISASRRKKNEQPPARSENWGYVSRD
jgi:hypothetical protein